MNRQSNLVEAVPLQDMGFDDLTGPKQGAFGVELRNLWSAIYRNRFVVAVTVAIALIVGVVVTMLSTPIYRATASVQIEQQAQKILNTEDEQPGTAAQEADRFLQTQVDLLRSRSLAMRVAEREGLLRDDSFLRRMGIEPPTEGLGSLDAKTTHEKAVVDALLDNLDVNLPRNSRIVDILFSSPDPRLAARIANSFAETYITFNLQRRFDTSSYARNFLQQRLAEAKQRLEESERAMIDYARQARLIDTGANDAGANGNGGGPRSLTTADLIQLNASYAQARTARLAAQERYAQALATPLLSLPEVVSNMAVQQLMQQRAVLQAGYDQERQRRKPEFPTMQQAAAQIASLDQQITRVASNIRAALRDQYLTALKQERALSGGVERLKADTLAEQDRSVRYNILKRETDTNRTMYDGLLQRFKEVSAAAGVTANNITMVDVAEVPGRPVRPRPMLNLAIAGLLGLIAAALLIFIREKFDDVIRSPEDVQRKLGVTFLNSIPLLRGEVSPAEALADPRSAISESYFALRTSLELVATGGLPRSLLLTSSRQSEGKSTTAVAVSRDFAKIGKKVILIDGDLRKPSLHRQLGLTNNNGLTSLLARHRQFEEVVQHTDLPNLDFLSCGPLPPNPAELLSGATMPDLLRQLGERYDLVVVDGPPVLGLADAVLLANNVEGTVFVIEANASHHGHAKAAIRRLSASGAHLIGAVLTKFDARSIGYGSEYGYYYSYSYGKELPSDAA